MSDTVYCDIALMLWPLAFLVGWLIGRRYPRRNRGTRCQ